MDGSPDTGAILDQSDPAAITLWGMAKHSLTLSSTKHIILHYRLETHRTQIYKHQGLINKLFTRAQFGARLDNIKSDVVNAQVSGEWVILCCYSSYTLGTGRINVMLGPTGALSHLDVCFIISFCRLYVFHHIPPSDFNQLPSFYRSPFLPLICPSCQISFSGYRQHGKDK